MKLDRLLGILTTLLQNDTVTAPYLAEKYEVTRRTIGRDIDTLCQAGIPIITKQGYGGGISIAEGFKLDKSVLTTDELSTMISALKGLGTVYGKSQMEKTLDKLSSGSDSVVSLRENVVIDLASHYRGTLTERISTLKRAVREQRIVEFDYYYEKGCSHRLVEPCFITFQWTAWYIFAYCLEREDFRLFKLARIGNLQLREATFSSREIPAEKLDMNAHLVDDKQLVAIFDPSVRYQLIENYGIDCYTEMPDGRLRLETGYTYYQYMLSWVLSFGDKIQVIEPPEMIADVVKAATGILHNYNI